jgi:hypothetical protein
MKNQRPDVFLTREERMAAQAKSPRQTPSAPPQPPEVTAVNDAAAPPQRSGTNPGSNSPARKIPDAIPVSPPHTKLPDTGARPKNPASIHDPPNQENIKETEQPDISLATNRGLPESDYVTTPTGEITASIPLPNLKD